MKTNSIHPVPAEPLATSDVVTRLSSEPPADDRYFLPYQIRWLKDRSQLRIIEKSRQIGITYADAYDSVRKASSRKFPAHVYVSSRDLVTTRLYLEHCKFWAETLHIGAKDLGEQVINDEKKITALVLRFANGRCIHSLSSHPDGLVGKHGHIKLDEFAVHQHQRELFRYAMPCTLWGFQLSIISTHRGRNSVFNEIITDITQKNNPMGWSHHRVTIHDAIRQGLVAKINAKSCRNDTPEQFLQNLRAKCIDEEQWRQEFCAIPADESSAFITYEMLSACESPNCLQPFSYLESSSSSSSFSSSTPDSSAHSAFYLGLDVARKDHLCVIDVGEKIGDVVWDRLRLELHNKTFAEIEHELWRILELPHVKRGCIDATGLGMQLAERAKARFGWKVEPIYFTPARKEELAFGLRMAFEDRTLRIDPDPKLRADLRGIKKEITSSGHVRFVGDSPDSHCDRFWAKALRQHAATRKIRCGAAVID